MKTIRASSLPRIMSCPASLLPPEICIEPRREEADLGTAVHAVLDDIVKEGLDSVPDLAQYVRRYEVDPEELRFLAWRGMELWSVFRPTLEPESLESERELSQAVNEDFRLTGHVDVSACLADPQDGRWHPPVLVIIDWKSGYVEREYFSQLMGYAWLAFWDHVRRGSPEGIGTPHTVKIVTAWLRAGVWDTLDVTAEDLENFERRLADVLSMQEEVFSPDDAHCVYCPRAAECPARVTMVQAAIRNLWPAEYQETALADREKLGVLHSQARTLRRVLDEYDAAVKGSIRRDGPIPLPGGGALTLQECIRQTISFSEPAAVAAAPHLGVPPADVLRTLGNEAATLNKDALFKAVADRAPRGGKTEARRAVMADLDKAGAVRTTAYEKLTILSAKQLEKESCHDQRGCGKEDGSGVQPGKTHGNVGGNGAACPHYEAAVLPGSLDVPAENPGPAPL